MDRTTVHGSTLWWLVGALCSVVACDADDGPPAGLVSWVGMGSGSGENALVDDPTCASYSAAVKRGKLPAAVAESSGLADSAFDPARLWTHNDSGGGPELFAVGADGRLLSKVTVEGADATDWEDIARGPCGPTDAARRCLYIANTGNNQRDRKTVEVFRVIEPETLQPTMTIRRLETMKLRYPAGATDAEALLVDDAGRVALFSKEEGRTRLFVAPFSTVGTVEATQVAEATLSDPNSSKAERITAADYDAARRRVAFRTYRNGYEVRLPQGIGIEGIAGLPVRSIPLADEAQGEALAYVEGGLVSTSEGAHAPLFSYDCTAASAATGTHP